MPCDVYLVLQGTIRENLDPLGLHSNRDMIGLLKMMGLWDVLAGLSLSRGKASGQTISAAIPYSSSVTSSMFSGGIMLSVQLCGHWHCI